MARLTLGGSTITDAFVDWNVTASNTPTLQLILDEPMDRGDWLPIPETICDAGRAVWEHDGVWRGFQQGESFENRRTYDHETESGSMVTGTWSYHHTIKRGCTEETIAATLSVGLRGSPSTFNVSLETARAAVERFINEDVNDTGASYWAALRGPDGPYSWASANASKERWDGYIDTDVALVEGDIYNYRPERI